MKFLTMILLFLVTNCYSQKFESLSSYYGTNYKLGFELNVVGKNDLSLGFGLTYDLNRKNVGGELLKEQIIYKSTPVTTKLYEIGSLYGTIGYNFSGTIVGAKLGFGSKTNYHYYTDNPNGKYYRTDGGTYLMYGLFVTRVKKKLSPYLGIDSYNGINMGVTYKFR